MQARVRGYLARRTYERLFRAEAYRTSIATEIMETEQTYVQNLDIIVEAFLTSLQHMAQQEKPFVTMDQLKVIFSEIEVIRLYNKNLLAQLQPRVLAWTPCQRMGDIFVKISPLLKVYTQYVNNFNDALAQLRALEKSSAWCSTIKQIEVEKGGHQRLDSFLIMPVQRIPRYCMLLSSMVKKTHQDHPDYKDLCMALATMEDVGKYVNEKKREAENTYKILELQGLFQKKYQRLAAPHRKYVCEGRCHQLRGEHQRVRFLYLFTDILLLAKDGAKIAVGPKRKVTAQWQLHRVQVRSVTEAQRSGGRAWHCLEVLCCAADEGASFMPDASGDAPPERTCLGFAERVDRDRWMEAIVSAQAPLLASLRAIEEQTLKDARARADATKQALAEQYNVLRSSKRLAREFRPQDLQQVGVELGDVPSEADGNGGSDSASGRVRSVQVPLLARRPPVAPRRITIALTEGAAALSTETEPEQGTAAKAVPAEVVAAESEQSSVGEGEEAVETPIVK
eukprot:TRINITY_DN4343_c0_g1_i2.p1 TRINITY_DN4343_c0_g1~~TRINITY_DN4343_c0_g1_i2.p1  ORF type:complete len:509 (+),score=121.74 TRINITY_DN4343_c0_g1_i2:848-2374(+)